MPTMGQALFYESIQARFFLMVCVRRVGGGGGRERQKQGNKPIRPFEIVGSCMKKIKQGSM